MNRNNLYEQNYNYVKNKIHSIKTPSYKDTLETFLDNQFTQSIDYDFQNHNTNLIKQNTEAVIHNHNNKNLSEFVTFQSKEAVAKSKPVQTIKANMTNKKISLSINSTNTHTILDIEYESYDLEPILNNNLCASILFVLSDMFRILSLKEKQYYIKELKYKMYLELSEKNLYKQFGYNKRKFKKKDLEGQLMKFETLNLLGQEYLMDYFNVNVIFYDLDKKTYLPYLKYNKSKKNIVIGLLRGKTTKDLIFVPLLKRDDENIFVETNKILEAINLDEIFNPYYDKLKGISSYKLLDLQIKCKHLQIDLFKIVDGKEKKKTKKDLYQDLKNIF